MKKALKIIGIIALVVILMKLFNISIFETANYSRNKKF